MGLQVGGGSATLKLGPSSVSVRVVHAAVTVLPDTVQSSASCRRTLQRGVQSPVQ